MTTDTASTAAVALWHRANGRDRWRRVAVFPTRAAALEAMRGAGDWLIRPAAAPDPNTDPRPR